MVDRLFRKAFILVFAVAMTSAIFIFPTVKQAIAQGCPPPAFHEDSITVDMSPKLDTNVQFQQHTVTATVTDPPTNTDPSSFALVPSASFQVSGANVASGPGLPIGPDQWSFTYAGAAIGDDTIIASVEYSLISLDTVCTVEMWTGNGFAAKHWSMFVVPESPIGIIALMGASLAALGGFMFWKRKQGNSQPHSLGDLGI